MNLFKNSITSSKCKLIFFTVCWVKVPKHNIVSAFGRVMATVLFQALTGVKKGSASLVGSSAMETVVAHRLGLLLWVLTGKAGQGSCSVIVRWPRRQHVSYGLLMTKADRV